MNVTPRRGGSGERTRNAVGTGFSVGCHLAILAALLSVHGQLPAPPEELPPISVALIDAPEPPLPDIPAAPAPSAPAQPAPKRTVTKTVPPPKEVVPIQAAQAPKAVISDGVSDAQLAGAASAGSGTGGGGACDMIHRIQTALRKDRLVQQAVAAHGGRAMMVWNGDWIQSGGQEGKGIAAVREAIMWEVGFAPEACRARPMRGLVQISLGDGAGSPRLVVGSDQWRWTELLHPRGGVPPAQR